MIEVALKDGRRVCLRRIQPGDAEALGEMLSSLSERTEYFFHPYPLNHESAQKVANDTNIVCLIATFKVGNGFTPCRIGNGFTPCRVGRGSQVERHQGKETLAVGYVWIERESEMPSLGICVRDGWHGVGIGRALMATIVEEAKKLGKRGIQLTVMQDNAHAIALYESFGFVVDGKVVDRYGPAFHMTLQFT